MSRWTREYYASSEYIKHASCADKWAALGFLF